MQKWSEFKKHKLGWYSFCFLSACFFISLMAEWVSNDKSLVVYYQHHWYFPHWNNPSELEFSGDFDTPTDYLDPYIHKQIYSQHNWVIFPINRYHFNSINYYSKLPNPAPPNVENWLGTDERGRDVLARLIYGFRVSMLFALALTAITTLLGIIIGAFQGYFSGRVDLYTQRVIEIWSSMPELYILIILSSILYTNILIILILMSLFGWIGIADYVRGEFLRNRQLDYVRAARALGLNTRQVIFRHILPNSLTPVVTFLPFRLASAITVLTSLDFLGLGVSSEVASLGELLAQGKNNLNAWWIGLSASLVLLITLLLLSFIGDSWHRILNPRNKHK